MRYRQHLSEAHSTFCRSSRGSSIPLSSENEEERRSTPALEEQEFNYQCGYCEFQAAETSEIANHHEIEHPDYELKLVELDSSKEDDDEEDDKNGGVGKQLPNLEPRVNVLRIPSSTIAQYDDSMSAHSAYENDDDHEDDDADADEYGQIEMDEAEERSGYDDEMKAEDEVEDVEDEAEDEVLDEEVEEEAEEEEEEEEENFAEDDVSQSSPLGHNFTRELGMVDDSVSSLDRSDPDMMIMKFDGRLDKNLTKDALLSEVDETNYEDHEAELEDGEDEHDDIGNDDDEEDDFDDANVTLSSPLPMISLGDSVTLSDDMFES